MPNLTPTPTTLLVKRIVERLDSTITPASVSREPQWTPSLVQRVLGAAAYAILESVANGEEVQLGALGRFGVRVLPERTATDNLNGGRKVQVPRRARLEFDPTPEASVKVQEFLKIVDELSVETFSA